MRGAPREAARYRESDDQIASAEHGVDLRLTAGQAMKLGERDRPFSRGSADDDFCVKRRERHGEVGRIGGNTVVGPAEDRVVAVEAVKGRAAGARPAFVARKIVLVAEVGAARALHHVAADRGHVAELAGGRGQQRLGDDGEAPAYLRIRCHIAHAGQGADAQAAIRQRLDPLHVGQTVDVEQPLGQRDAVLDQPEEVGAAGDEGELWIAGVGRYRRARIGGSRKSERMHHSAPPRRVGDGLDDVGIAGAAAQIAAHPFPDLGL